MVILGVTNTGDSGAALIVDGKIVAAANEERFVRKKLIRSFPKAAISWVLESQGLSIRDVDRVGVGCWKGIDLNILPVLVRDLVTQAETGGDVREAQHRIQVSLNRDAEHRTELFEELAKMGISRKQIFTCDHHYSHALTAFYPSPFEEALVFTADGRGDHRSVSLWEATRADGLKLLDSASELSSPGALYGIVTKQLGFIPDRHEGKVTGLAAHGRRGPAYDLLRSVFGYEEAEGVIKAKIGEYYRPFAGADLPALTKAIEGIPREDVAFAAQQLLEETLCGFLARHLRDKPARSVDLCLAGGCMSNVKLNYELGRLPQIRQVYVFPQMGDGGNAMGGALAIAVDTCGVKWFELPSAYLGPEYSDEEIRRTFESEKIPFRTLTESERSREVAGLLADNKIVGWYQGRMEYGPRALGNRTILAAATDAAINDVLNARLHRTEFMPFAPVTIDEYATRCVEGWSADQTSSQFMTICYRATEFLRERCPAVVHVDGTVRPQVVFREKNPAYYDVIKAYIEKTGNPALINTSFNHHEEPIINTPADAVRSFRKGNVDVLMAGSLIAESV